MNIKNNLILFFLLGAFYTPVTYTVRYKTAVIAKMTQQALINLIQTGKDIEIEGSDLAADTQRTRILNLKLELERQRTGMGAGMGAGAGAGLGAGMGGGGTGGGTGSGAGAGMGGSGTGGGMGSGTGTGTGTGMGGGGAGSGTGTGKGAGTGTTANPDESTPTSEDEGEKEPKEKEAVIKKAQFIKPAIGSASNEISDACIVAALKEIALEAYVGVSTLKTMKTLAAFNGIQTGNASYLYYIKDRLATLAGMNPEFKNQAALAAFIGDNEKEPGYIVLADGVNTNKPGVLDTFCENRLSIAKVGLQNIHDNFATISDAFKAEIKKLLFSPALADENKTYIDFIVANIAVSQRPSVGTKIDEALKDTSNQQAFFMMDDFIKTVTAPDTITAEQGKNLLNALRDNINLLRLDPKFMKYEALLGSKALDAAENETDAFKKNLMYPFLLALMDTKKLPSSAKAAIQVCNFQLLYNPDFFTIPGPGEDGIPDYTEKMTALYQSIIPKISMQQRIEESILNISSNLTALNKNMASAIGNIQKEKSKQKYQDAALKVVSLLAKLKTPLSEAILKLAAQEPAKNQLKKLENTLKTYSDANRDTLITTLDDLSLDLAGTKTGLSAEAKDALKATLDAYKTAQEGAALNKEPILALLRAIKTAFKDKGSNQPVDDVISTQLDALIALSPDNKAKIDRVWSSLERNAPEIAPLFVTKAVSLDEIKGIITEKDWYKISNSYGLIAKILSQIADTYANQPTITPVIDSLEAVQTGKIESSGKQYAPIITDNKIKPLILSKIYINPATPITPMIKALNDANILEFINLVKAYIKAANDKIDLDSKPIMASIAKYANYLVKVYIKDVKDRIKQLMNGAGIDKDYAIPGLGVTKMTERGNKDIYETVKGLFTAFNTMIPESTLDAGKIIQAIDIDALNREKDKIVTRVKALTDDAKATLFGNYLNTLIEKLQKITNAKPLFPDSEEAGGPPPPPGSDDAGAPPPPPPPPPM